MNALALALSALVALFLPAFLPAGEAWGAVADSRITAVTVYPDRALTTRTATLNLKAGSQTVTFDGLPAAILDDSVRVEGRGSAAAKLAGIEVKRLFLPMVPEKRVKELQEELRQLARKGGELDSRQAALAAQKAFLESIRVAYGDRISKELGTAKPAMADLSEALKFVGDGLLKVEGGLRDVEADRKTLAERTDALRRELEQVQGSGRKEAKSVEVTLEAAAAGSVTLELSYVIPQAGWEPAYDVRLAPDGGNVELAYKALVRQRTGEEWDGARLSLSTARPAVGGNPPELQPWRVSFYRPPVPMPHVYGAMAAPMVREKGAARPAGSADGEMMMPDTALVEEERTSVLFRIARPAEIPSDGFPHAVTVAVEEFPVAAEYLAVPKLSPHAYLKSSMTNRTPYPLLPGRANIFLGGNFTSTAHLKKVAPGEDFDLFFGTDDAVTVKREEIRQHKEAGFMGKNRMSYRYRIEAANFRKEPQTVTVLDQLPLAGDEEIKVSLEEATPQPDEIDAGGTMRWKLPLQSGEKREIVFEIRVEYPKDREVTGL